MKDDKDLISNYAKKYEELGYWEPLTLGGQLRTWAEKYKDRIAVVEDNSRLTYTELDRRANELASGFFNMGIRKGCNVVVQLPNRISFIITCFALFRVGAVPILSLPAHRESELDGIFSAARPVAYIIPSVFQGFDYKKMADELVRRHPYVKFVITDGRGKEGINLDEIRMPPIELESPSYRDTALLLLSGGTTDIPKLIPRTHSDYAYNAKASAARCKLNSHSVYLAVLPVAHNFPLCCPGILGTLSVGGKIVLCGTPSCDEAFPLIEKEKVTITALVPAMVNIWLEVLEWDDSYDISSLEVIQVGGAMLDENIAKRIMPEMKCKLQQVFGTAEGLICCTSLDDADEIIHSCQGRPISEGDEIRIVDEGGYDVRYGEYGELIVRGPYTIKGYYETNGQNLKEFTQDGFYRTGDKARITEDGNIQIGGRIKEQINRAGEKIMPAEIESYLCLHPDIREAALIGIPDKNLGQKSCAFLVTDNKEISLADIYKFLNDKGLARYKMPDQIRFIDSWPFTSVGKVDKTKLKEIATELEDKHTAYHEGTVDFDGDAHLTAVQVIESGLFNDFLLYEEKEELSVAMGVYAFLHADPEFITIKTSGRTQRFENQALSEAVNKAFSTIELNDWRAYGIANFGLCRYNHKLPLLSEDRSLLKLFIPEVELRFKKGSILVRAIKKEMLQKIYELVRNISAGDSNMNALNSLEKRTEIQKLEIPWVNTHASEEYMKIVAEAVKEINDRKYQKVILSRRIPLNREIDLAASYIAGRRVNSPARSFLLSIDGFSAAGFSPETLVEADSEGWVSTFPLAGTRSRGRNTEEEKRLKEELLNDSKEIAEHAVSVKLAFEELQQVCEPETIAVSDFMSVAGRGTVQHIASRLKGKLKPSCNAWHAFNILFPAVTASGIPKKESIEAIGRLESAPRNLYSGCVMTFDRDGSMDAALVLRTIYQKDRNAWLQAGAGIVEMSMPSRELEETCEKLSSFSRQLIPRQ